MELDLVYLVTEIVTMITSHCFHYFAVVIVFGFAHVLSHIRSAL